MKVLIYNDNIVVKSLKYRCHWVFSGFNRFEDVNNLLREIKPKMVRVVLKNGET